uniref:HTH_48 domain-containing protein n=1 Tax=Caenorhabditis tropicalis TaxID=1561998 RepID=A0A1I7U5K2_9PELO
MTETLTEERYVRDITSFANSSRGDVWTLHLTPLGITAKQSAICRYEDIVINRQAQFQYNRKMERLELWFMFYCRSNGRPLRIREIAEIIGTKPEENDAIVVELSQHPTLHIPYYKLYKNPEDAGELIVPNGENYVARWISAYGSEAGLGPAPSTYSECNSSCNQSTTSTEDS